MKPILTSLIILLSVCAGYSQVENLPNKIQALAASYQRTFGFTGTIKFVSGDTSAFEKSYGLANRSFGIKNSPNTRFSINSISKIFTAVAILKLAEEGKVDLHTPINTYLTDLEASWAGRVTLHHLLTHSSGLPRESGVQPQDKMTFSEQLNLVAQQSLLFAPGERYEYSNGGIILLGAIIEQVSGESYESFIHQYIIRPLKLEDTGYYRGKTVVERQAVPYRLSFDGLVFAQRSKHYGDNAGGGLYSTPADLYEFVKALEEGRLLTRPYVELMFLPHLQSSKTEAEGYAWSIKYFGEEKIYFAAGSGYGTKSVMIRMPDSGDFIGITSNWGNTPILQLLGDIYLLTKGQDIELPSQDELADPAVYVNHLGTYRFKREELTKQMGIDRDEITLQVFDGKLFLGDELLAAEGGFLKLTYTNELNIHFAGGDMIININGNILKGKKGELRE